MFPLKNKKITLIVTGSIAAYKACEIVRLLRKKEATVHVVLTQAAESFIGAATLQALSGNAVSTDNAPTSLSHITLAQNVDAIVVAPATANTIAKAACGLADNLASNILLAHTVPVLYAPAMNSAMWANPATCRNVAFLKENGAAFVGPESGSLACGACGAGRMTEATRIVEALEALMSKKILLGKKVLVTAGPTVEPIDPVRAITNHSSGKQGYAVAKAAFEAGADVTLVTGPTALDVPYGVKAIPVKTALQMQNAVFENLNGVDAFVGVAAVADWRPKVASEQKIKKDGGTIPTFELEANPDIVMGVAHSKKRPQCVVGFAAETENVVGNGLNKLQNKGLDLIVANNATATFGKDTNSVIFLSTKECVTIEKSDKLEIARELVGRIAEILEGRHG